MTRLRKELESRVDRVVRATKAALPSDLRTLAERVPVYCEWNVAAHWLEDGVMPDSMGLFSGPSLADPEDPDCFEMPRITLFLAELWRFCEEDFAAFDEEARVTYVHEFGHYLGLEEEDLAARGLL